MIQYLLIMSPSCTQNQWQVTSVFSPANFAIIIYNIPLTFSLTVMGGLSYMRPATTRNLTVHISPAIPLTLLRGQVFKYRLQGSKQASHPLKIFLYIWQILVLKCWHFIFKNCPSVLSVKVGHHNIFCSSLNSPDNGVWTIWTWALWSCAHSAHSLHFKDTNRKLHEKHEDFFDINITYFGYLSS